MKVELLVAPGCASAKPTERLIYDVLAQAGAGAALEVMVVETPEEAAGLRFPGSPTVRVDGRDLEPEADLAGNFGLG